MQRFIRLIKDCLSKIDEKMPWDADEILKNNPALLILDVREQNEYEMGHIKGSILIPRGILESACEWNFDETIPKLVRAREQPIMVVCRSGHRSLLAVHSMQVLGYKKAFSLKTGLRGWNDYDLPLVNQAGETVDMDEIDDFFTTKLRDDQKQPDDWET